MRVADCAPAVSITAALGATHVRFVMGGGEIDFETGVVASGLAESGNLKVNETAGVEVLLETQVTAGSVHPLFLVLGVVFGQEVNRQVYGLNAAGFNALGLVRVDGVGT